MADTTIPDSYITTDTEFETYLTGDPRAAAIALLAASSSVQAWYLKRATKIIDGLPFKGQTYYDIGTGENEQERQFPRWIDGQAYVETDSGDGAEVPQEVIDACCEEAIALYAFYSDSDRTDRKTMKDDGVQNYNLGGVYSEALGASHFDKHGLMSSEARRLLSGYLSGSVEMVF